MNDSRTPRRPDKPTLAGTERFMWGGSILTLYGTPDAPQVWAETAMRGQVGFKVDRAALVRFAREILTWTGEENGATLPAWQTYNHGASKRPWFLARGAGIESDRIPIADRYHYNGAGNLVRFASMESAQRAADKLNAAEASSHVRLDSGQVSA